MTHFFKYGANALIATMILSTGLIILLILFFELNIYKPLINNIVKENIYRDLEFDGDISFATFPTLRVSLKNVTLSEYMSNNEFVTAELIQFKLPLRKIIKKQLVIDELTTNGLNITLLRFADGSTNIDDLLTPRQKSTAFKFNQVQVKNTTLLLHDAINKKQVILNDLALGANNLSNKSIDMLKLKTTGSIENFTAKDKKSFTVTLRMPTLQFFNHGIRGKHAIFAVEATHLPRKIQSTFDLSNFMVAKDLLNVELITVNMVAKKDAQTFKFQLKSAVDGILESQKLHFSDFKTKFAITTKNISRQVTRGSLQGSISANGLLEHLHSDLTGYIENSQIDTTFNISGFDRPAVSFNAVIDRLDTTQFNLETFKFITEEKKFDNTQSRDKVTLSSKLNINGSLHIDVLQFDNIVLNNIVFNIQSTNNATMK